MRDKQPLPQGWVDISCGTSFPGTICEFDFINTKTQLAPVFEPGSAAAIMIENLTRRGTLTGGR